MVDGIRLSSVAAGIRYQNRNDLLLIEIAPDSSCAAVFTKNAFCAAPVTLAKAHLAAATPRYLVINSGNANAGTGEQGLENARAVCQRVAELGAVEREQVLPFSTGVIGAQLPVQRFLDALPNAVNQLQQDAWQPAAEAIMTTDTVPKLVQKKFSLGSQEITLVGIAKGAGMICPNMATMLAFIATDANIARDVLQHALSQAADQSFNCVTVDGDTSTNDACVLMATGRAQNEIIDSMEHSLFAEFARQLNELTLELALKIVRDGEGATKCVRIRVDQGSNNEECKQVAYTIAHSPLVKTAMFANDPNWGRILAAVGRAPVDNLDISRVSIALDNVAIITQGLPVPDFNEADVQQVMDRPEYAINVTLGRGDAQASVWTTDLSHDYVTINAEYRT